MKTLKGKILIAVTTVVLVAFAGCWIPLSRILEKHITRESERETARQATLVARILEDASGEKPVDGGLLAGLASDLGCRISIIDGSGRVMADTEGSPDSMDNHKDRPEIALAFSSGRGTEIRYSRSLGTTMIYAAQRLSLSGKPAVVRLSYRLSALDEAVREGLVGIMSLLLLTAVSALALTHLLIRRLFQPMDRIVNVAGRIAAGERVNFPIMSDRELQRLSGALDDMSRRLCDAMEDIRKQRGDLETIISAMPVGLVLLDRRKSIRMINDCARGLLDLKTGVLLPGKLHPLIEEAAQSGEIRSTSLDIRERDLFVSATARPIETGIVMVLQDMTREHRLDVARRNFIADASHEFQTPLTSIGVTAEFLLEEEDPKAREKYLLSIIEQQKRLTGLVDDMLLLSRLEAEPPQEEMEPLNLAELVSEVVAEHREHPLAAQINVDSELPLEAICTGRRENLARAIGNVVGNGIKYVRQKFGDAPGGRVAVSIRDEDDDWVVVVDDNGTGISESPGGSIFERFNRGDSSRARGGWGQGGYGLGLAIAKKIVEGHDGRIELTKSTGGATFEIRIPKGEAFNVTADLF